MWKYVSRRFKDTVEKTYNVFDVRSKVYTSSIQQNQKCLKICEDGCSSGGSDGGSSSGRERFKEKFGTSSGRGIHNSFLGALTWVSFFLIFCLPFKNNLISESLTNSHSLKKTEQRNYLRLVRQSTFLLESSFNWME